MSGSLDGKVSQAMRSGHVQLLLGQLTSITSVNNNHSVICPVGTLRVRENSSQVQQRILIVNECNKKHGLGNMLDSILI